MESGRWRQDDNDDFPVVIIPIYNFVILFYDYDQPYYVDEVDISYGVSKLSITLWKLFLM